MPAPGFAHSSTACPPCSHSQQDGAEEHRPRADCLPPEHPHSPAQHHSAGRQEQEGQGGVQPAIQQLRGGGRTAVRAADGPGSAGPGGSHGATVSCRSCCPGRLPESSRARSSSTGARAGAGWSRCYIHVCWSGAEQTCLQHLLPTCSSASAHAAAAARLPRPAVQLHALPPMWAARDVAARSSWEQGTCLIHTRQPGSAAAALARATGGVGGGLAAGAGRPAADVLRRACAPPLPCAGVPAPGSAHQEDARHPPPPEQGAGQGHHHSPGQAGVCVPPAQVCAEGMTRQPHHP